MSRKTPTPIRVTPSSAPYEAMAASQQAHIDDLVQKNRTLAHTADKLKDQLAREESRSKDALHHIRLKWEAERKEWLEGCETLQACHRIVNLRTTIQLDAERLAVLKEREIVRQERLAKLQRDYRLSLFTAKEAEWESQLLDLEQELATTRQQHILNTDSLVQQHQQTESKLKERLVRVATDCSQKGKDALDAKRERDEIAIKYTKLREMYDTLDSSASAHSAQFERLNLQLDGLKTTIRELERANDELQLSNSDLKRQLDKWQNLDNKGGAEMETLRKRRVELEVQVKELEGRLSQLEAADEEHRTMIEKQKRKLERYKAVKEEFEQALAESEAVLQSQDQEAEQAKVQLASALQEIEELKAQHQEELAAVKSRPNNPRQAKILHEADPDGEDSGDELQPIVPPMKKRGQAKPPSTTRNVSLARPADQEDVIEVFDDLDSHDKVKKAKGAKQPPSEATKAHRKPPSKKQARDGGEQTAKGQEKPVKSEKPQGKRVKHASLDEGDEDAQIVKVKKGRAGDVSRGKQKHVLEEDANDGEESDQDPLPKKKRKIQVVPNGPAASFTWDKLNMGDGGLDIPTELSPIKDSEVPKTVPGRLGTARGLGPFGRR